MTLFDQHEVETYLSNLFPKKTDKVQPLSKTLLEAVPYEENNKKENSKRSWKIWAYSRRQS